MRTDAPAIAAHGLRARYGDTPVLRGVDFTLGWGEALAVLGPNGAGKTTLLRLLSGALRPTGGELTIAGLDPARQGNAVRRQIGVLSHQTFLYGELTARENLRFYGRLYRIQALDERVAARLEQVGLYGRRDDRVDSLSRGQQQRLALARAVLHDPAILLMDEPETGLDLAGQGLLDALLFCEPGRSVVMATHNLEQARRLCGRAVVLVRGRLSAELGVTEVGPERLAELYRETAAVSG